MLSVLGLAACSSTPKHFDVWHAMSRLQKDSPASGETFTKFFVPAGSKVKVASQKLEPMIDTAARRHRRLGVLGPDAELNAEVVEAAFKTRSAGELKGMTLVYVGPGQNRQRIKRVVTPTGATFIFTKYPRKNPD